MANFSNSIANSAIRYYLSVRNRRVNMTLNETLLVDQAKGLHGRQAFESAWEEIVNRYEEHMRMIAYDIVHRQCVAKEITQNAFMNAMDSIDSFQVGNFSGWLRLITRNLAFNHHRNEKRRRAIEEHLLFGNHVEQPTERVLHNGKLANKLTRVMTKELTPEQITTVMLFADGYKYREIAERTHVRIGTVMSRLHRARRTIQQCVNDEFSPDDF